MKKILLIAFITFGTISCETDFSTWNKDEKNPATVPANTLFSNAQRNLARLMKKQNVNDNIFNFLAQYWTATTYPDESNYDLAGRDVTGGFWNRMYRDVLLDFQEAQNTLDTERETLDPALIPINTNQKAVTAIMQAYSFHVLVDIFGNVPYSEALNIDNASPKYDDASEIYADLFVKLNSAINDLDPAHDSFGGSDFIYNGDVSAWLKFANTLKLRMALRVKDAGKVAEAVAGGVFESNADNAAFPFTISDPYSNPLWENLVQSNRNDLLVSDSFVDLISPLNDPRAEVYMADNKSPYVGGPYGGNNSYNSYTHLGSIFHKPDFEGVILDYAETEFLLAEAAALTLGGVSDAENHYNAGVKASINYWAPDADADAYVSAQPYDAANWKESIGTQKYIALYSRGFEGWTSWRTFGFPVLNAPAEAHVSAEGLVPVRYTYPVNEPERNGVNYEAASSAIGGDKFTTRVFWNN